jgi:hypothetical protein
MNDLLPSVISATLTDSGGLGPPASRANQQPHILMMVEEFKERESDEENLPTSPMVMHISVSLYKFNKRPSAMIWSVTPDHTPGLRGYQDYDPLRKRSQCNV